MSRGTSAAICHIVVGFDPASTYGVSTQELEEIKY